MENITFIGLGKLGLPISLLFEKAGYNVLGVDINEDYVSKLNSKTFQCNEPSVNELLKNSNKFKATTNLEIAVKQSNYIFILVNSSVDLDSYYNMDIISNLLTKINKLSDCNKNIIISSTLQIGYINKIGNFLLHNDKFNHTLSYFPEFVRIGKVVEDMLACKMPFIFGSEHDHVISFLRTLINNIVNIDSLEVKFKLPNIHEMSPESAEIAKFASNSFKTIKITYANMIGDICDKSYNCDKFKVMKSLNSDVNIQNGCFIPGYGYGGPCFPRDNLEFGNYINSIGVNTCILEATENYNKYHAIFQAHQLAEENKHEYVFTNVCYRKDCPVAHIEACQELKVASILSNLGKNVTIKDNENVLNLVKNKYGKIFNYKLLNE